MRSRRSFAHLCQDRRAVSAVEFALVAPVVLMTLFGLFDLGYNIYTAEQLEGAIQKTARDSTIEGALGKLDALDARVTRRVHTIAPAAELEFTRTAYSTYGDIDKPEQFDDINTNGQCDAGEPYEDSNGNGRWDPVRGARGTGSARDAVLYEVTVRYPRPFPVTALFGMDQSFTMVSRTVLRNQPYETNEASPSVRNCA